mmetsp:Transcript_15153/g.25682  ORF Transcript_15153/g.25682 Transcript_15153/m.25682 type:complete len:233 (+) Transcript_15153:1-699(+)
MHIVFEFLLFLLSFEFFFLSLNIYAHAREVSLIVKVVSKFLDKNYEFTEVYTYNAFLVESLQNLIQILLTYRMILLVRSWFKKKELILCFYCSFTFWMTNTTNFIVEFFILYCRNSEDKKINFIENYLQTFLSKILRIAMVLLSYWVFVRELDREDFDYFTKPDSRVASIEITHYFHRRKSLALNINDSYQSNTISRGDTQDSNPESSKPSLLKSSFREQQSLPLSSSPHTL